MEFLIKSDLRSRARMLARTALSAPKARTREKGKDFVHDLSAEGAHAQRFLRESQVCIKFKWCFIDIGIVEHR